MNELYVRKELERFLLEDLGRTEVAVDEKNPVVEAHIIAEEAGVLCGARYIAPLLRLLLPDQSTFFQVSVHHTEGTRLEKGMLIARVTTDAEIVRHGIRTALNLVAHLSGIATHTRRKVDELKGLPVHLLDTRKTTPGFRAFEKYAVRVGGGYNHRFNREDGILIKKEDSAIDGGIVAAIDRAYAVKAHLTAVEVEVETLEELDEVLADGRVCHILLDNMDLETMRKAVLKCGPDYVLEASGVGERNLYDVASVGVDCISLSSLIRGARPLVMKMKIIRVMQK